MERKSVSVVMMALLVIGISALAFKVQIVRADVGTIYINADGSITPSTAPVSTLDNATYTLTSNIISSSDGIIVERDNIIIDGDQYMVQGAGTSIGINVAGRSNVTVQNTTISSFVRGIYLDNTNRTTISGNNIANNAYGIDFSSSSNVSISGNNITATSEYGIRLGSSSNVSISGNNITANISYGIYLASSSNNTISGNNIANNLAWLPAASGGIVLIYSSNNNSILGNTMTNSSMGVSLYGCSKNSISGNNITANGGGINLEDSSNNTIYHNNFIGNAFQVSSDGSSNTWDNGYPSGGNYWSDYNGTDLYSGQHQNVTGSDGVGDTPYVIDANNTDDYPLMGVFSDFNVAEGVDVQVVSNSTISDFQFNGTALLFDVSGVNGTTGFCNVRVPTVLLNGTLTVLVNAIQVQYNLLPSLNDNQSYLYFTYGHSTEQVTITPEFPSSLIMAMFMLATLLTITIHKKTK